MSRIKRIKRPPGRLGKKQNKEKLPDMPKFQRSKDADPNAPVKIRKVSMAEMVKTTVNREDEKLGIY